MIPEAKVVATEKEKGLVITVNAPGLRGADFEITQAGKGFEIVNQQRNGPGPFKLMVEIPPGYNVLQAKAGYLNGNLRIDVPPAGRAPPESHDTRN